MEKITNFLKQRTTLRYWAGFISPKALRYAFIEPFSKFKSELTKLIINFFLAIITVFFSITWNPSLTNLNSYTTIVYVIIVMFLLRLVWGFIYFPVEVFEKQGGFIENPFEITTPDSRLDYDQPTKKWATIKITNSSKNEKILNCFVELNKIVNAESSEIIPFEPQVLMWSGRDGDSDTNLNTRDLIPGHPRWCDIAIASSPYTATVVGRTEPANKSELFIARYNTRYGVNSNHNVIKAGKYRLVIKIYGDWKNYSISQSYLLDLTYQPHDASKIFAIDQIVSC